MVYSDLFALASGHLNIHACYMFTHLVMLNDFNRNMHRKCIHMKLDEFFMFIFKQMHKCPVRHRLEIVCVFYYGILSVLVMGKEIHVIFFGKY